MDTIDLKNKTIFDFTNDEDLIAKITMGVSKSYYLSEMNDISRLQDIEELSVLIGDSNLQKIATQAKKKAWDEWDKKASQYYEEGVIID